MRSLVVAASEPLRAFLSELLSHYGCEVTLAAGPTETLAPRVGPSVDVAVVDLDMPAQAGLRAVEWLRARYPSARVVGIAARPAVSSIVQAMRLGAADVVPDPAQDPVPLQEALTRALEARLRGGEGSDVAALAAAVGLVLGVNPDMWRLASFAVRVARYPLSVLIQGETGSGKELFARLIHRASSRAKGPFVDLNCGAVPGDLLASELFGHEPGAFTGARQMRRGLFELASGGTLFLDEIADASPEVQVSLLRVLETGTFRRLGGEEPLRVDVRLVAATHVPLEQAVEEGRFRSDLFYRLDMVTLHVPPLRERPEDIPLLAEHFLRRFLPPDMQETAAISPAAVDMLCCYPWPGNVRELANAMGHAAALTPNGTVQPEHLPPRIPRVTRSRSIQASPSRTQPPGAAAAPQAPRSAGEEPRDPIRLAEEWAEAYVASLNPAGPVPLERLIAAWQEAGLRAALRVIRWALARTHGDRQRAAELLGVSPRTLRYLLSEKGRVRTPADRTRAAAP